MPRDSKNARNTMPPQFSVQRELMLSRFVLIDFIIMSKGVVFLRKGGHSGLDDIHLKSECFNVAVQSRSLISLSLYMQKVEWLLILCWQMNQITNYNNIHQSYCNSSCLSSQLSSCLVRLQTPNSQNLSEMRSTLIEGVSVLIESKGILNFGSCRFRFFGETLRIQAI